MLIHLHRSSNDIALQAHFQLCMLSLERGGVLGNSGRGGPTNGSCLCYSLVQRPSEGLGTRLVNTTLEVTTGYNLPILNTHQISSTHTISTQSLHMPCCNIHYLTYHTNTHNEGPSVSVVRQLHPQPQVAGFDPVRVHRVDENVNIL